MRQISCTPQFIKLYLIVETRRQFCKSYNSEYPGYSICLGWVAPIQVNNNNRRHGDIFWLFVTLISNFRSSLPNFLLLSKRLQGIQLQRNRDKPAIKISSQIPSRRVQSSNTAFIFSQILQMQAPSTSGHQYRRRHSMPYTTHPNLPYSSYQSDALNKDMRIIKDSS